MLKIDDLVDYVHTKMELSLNKTPTVNNIYDTFLYFFPQFSRYDETQYNCIRKEIILQLKQYMDKNKTLTIVLLDSLKNISTNC